MTQGASAGLSFKARRKFTLNGVDYEQGADVPLSVIPPEKFEKWRSSRLIVPSVDRPRSVAAQSALAMQEAGAAPVVPVMAVIDMPPGAVGIMPPGTGGGGGGSGDKMVVVKVEPGREGIPGGGPIEGVVGSYIQHVGRGWYIVYHDGAEPVKVRGAGPAGDKLRELRGEAGEGKGVTILGGGDGEKAGLAANGVSQDEPSGPGDGASSEGGDAPPLAGENGEAAQMAAMSEAG